MRQLHEGGDMMNTYYAVYEKDKNLFDDHVFEGKTPAEAARKAYPGKKIVPVYGEQARCADLILVECRVLSDGVTADQVRIKSHAKLCCYLIE